MDNKDVLEYAGHIEIDELYIVSGGLGDVDLHQYLVELNLFEDIFSSFLHGTLVLSDSRNLIANLPIIGEEYLVIKLRTPSIDAAIEKVFRIYSITDRKAVNDKNTEIYTLHFCSREAILNTLYPLYNPFEGKISDVVTKIYNNFLKTPRTLVRGAENSLKESDESSDLFILNDTSNSVKFISPGWAPTKCINWLCSKAIPAEGKGSNFLFWESSQAFYFGNIEKIFIDTHKTNIIKGEYYYYPPNLNKTKDIVKKMFITQDFEVTRLVDGIENYKNGYLSNRILTVDLYKKDYDVTDFDYVENYNNYKHITGENAVPMFANNAPRSPTSHVKFYPVNPKLFTGFENNVNERIKDVYGNRKALLSEINNFSIHITVPGRADMEAGSIINFIYPDIESRDMGDSPADILYSGLYLISAIHHKITLENHVMIMELVKDSFTSKKIT